MCKCRALCTVIMSLFMTAVEGSFFTNLVWGGQKDGYERVVEVAPHPRAGAISLDDKAIVEVERASVSSKVDTFKPVEGPVNDPYTYNLNYVRSAYLDNWTPRPRTLEERTSEEWSQVHEHRIRMLYIELGGECRKYRDKIDAAQSNEKRYYAERMLVNALFVLESYGHLSARQELGDAIKTGKWGFKPCPTMAQELWRNRGESLDQLQTAYAMRELLYAEAKEAAQREEAEAEEAKKREEAQLSQALDAQLASWPEAGSQLPVVRLLLKRARAK